MHHTTSYIARRQQAARVSDRGAIRVELLRRIAIGVAVLVVLALLLWALRGVFKHRDSDAPKRQIAKISVLPDTPPPPPPPPPKERKEESPRQEQRSQPVPDNTPKPQASEQIKMEGAAGNGPSAFGAGSVTKDYAGGTPNQGTGTGSGDALVDRAAERLYAGTARQALLDELERHLSTDATRIQARFWLWVSAEGRIERWEVEPGAQDGELLNDALKKCADTLRLPPPRSVRQPMRLSLSQRHSG